METLTRLLPPPSQSGYDRGAEEAQKPKVSLAVINSLSAPPLGQRRGWIPRTQQDFGDGGAYPEILVAQYPLGLGQKQGPGSGTSNALAKQLDADGRVKYDVLARVGHAQDKVVHSKFQDLVPKTIDESNPELQKPDEEQIKEMTEKTRQALEKLVQRKISAAMPVRAAEKLAPAEYIRYTPAQQGVAYNSGAKQRIIRMVEVQKDPMEPPRFKTNKKIPKGPPSPPAPVMHSPNRKVTVKEQQEWKIPPCISNWKNAKGFTIPLDKRLAADGRGLQSVHINENFAKLAEALYIADRKAREAVEMRAQIEKKLAQKEKEKREENLRQLAQRAREERAGITRPGKVDEKDEDVQERDDLRKERMKDRQRDRNLARAAPDKRNRLEKERERDISEKIALGLPNPGHRDSGGTYDQRLFNQSQGMDSGFAGGEDESYNVYDKPWRADKSLAESVYRPSKNIEKDVYGDDLDKLIKTNRFVPDKEFSGTDRSGGARRDGPVQFEKDEDEDPFGLNVFLDAAKRGQKRDGGDHEGRGGGPSRDTKKSRRD